LDETNYAGDLSNIVVGADGIVEDEFLAEHVTLESGTALIIHAEADDGRTQPPADSGDRIACGIV